MERRIWHKLCGHFRKRNVDNNVFMKGCILLAYDIGLTLGQWM